MTVKQDLEKAMEVLDAHGWCQGDYRQLMFKRAIESCDE